MKRLPCVRVCMHACVCSSHFYINLYISFIYEDIFTEISFKKNMATTDDCSKIMHRDL